MQSIRSVREFFQRMKPLSLGTKLSLLVAFVLISYYVGRPIYWEVMSRAVQGYGDPLRSPPTTNSPVLEQDQKQVVKPQRNATTKPSSSKESTSSSKEHEQEHQRELEKKRSLSKKFSDHKVLQMPIWGIPPAGTKLPPREAFALSKEMIQFRAQKNVILVTFANHAFGDFALTWVRHLTDVGVSNLLVGAMDRKLLDELFWKGVPVFDMGSEMNTADVGWGTPTFHKMGREKVFLVNAIMAMGFEVLFCDTDMVWLKNPLPYMERFPDADILVSSDAVVATTEDDSLEDWRRSFSALNIGIFHWRPTPASKKFARAWQVQLEDEKIWDQNGFNDLVIAPNGTREPVDAGNERGLFYGYHKSVKIGILPVSIFCSGHTYFVQHLHQQLKLEVYAVHTTFQFAGTDGKRHRLREAKLFYDNPEYYSTSGGFITFNASIPEKLLTGGAHSVETHFALVNYQLKQVRDALAIASILKRTLVMPPIWCRFDRLWFGHPGILQDTKTPQPFLCPMDHVFELQNMLKPGLEAELGPIIDFREYSFLENSHVSKAVKTSRLIVTQCNGECNSNPAKGLVEIPTMPTEIQLTDELMKHKDVHVLEFPSMQNMFGGFVDQERGAKFRRRMQRYTGVWCCLPNFEIGHIYYDIYWDEKPGWKPHPPSTHEDDHPPFD